MATQGAGLVMKQRPDKTIPLTPIYKDAFAAPPLGMVIFRRDGTGRVTGLTVSQDRVWDMRVSRQGAGSAP